MPNKMSIVAVVRTNPKTVIQDYAKLCELGGLAEHIKKEIPTILKLNLSWSLYYPACSTEPWQLHGLLEAMKQQGYDFKKLIPVENKTVVTDVWKGAKGNKWLPILRQYGLKYKPLTAVKWVKYRPKAKLLALHKVFREGHEIPEFFKGKQVIHLPTLKTHGHTRMTGAMKNAFGGLITTKRHHCHKHIHEVLVDLLIIQKELHPGMFAVMDGAVAGDGAGPRTMVPKTKNILLASADQVAIDAASAYLMGYDPLKIPFIKLAHDRGLGQGDINKIKIVGMSRPEFMRTNFHFTTNKSPVIFWDQMLRKRIKGLEPLLFHTPLFRAFIFGSAFYHDYVWYNFIGRKRIKRFNKTAWGRLWKEYK
jgi:uncharacterized protein (DUF362 family)